MCNEKKLAAKNAQEASDRCVRREGREGGREGGREEWGSWCRSFSSVMSTYPLPPSLPPSFPPSPPLSLFLGVYLRQHHGGPSLPPYLTSGLVISLGMTSFTLLLPALDLEHRLNIHDIPGVASSSSSSSSLPSSSSSERTGTPAPITSLTLHPFPPPSLPPWTPADASLTLRLFSKVRVAVSVKPQSIDLLVNVVGVE